MEATARISRKDSLLGMLRGGEQMARGQQYSLIMLLCAPAILAQLASIMLQFIDASMVGRLGAVPSASIGLVATTTWILVGFCTAVHNGFSVQVAHLIGANDLHAARQVVRQGLVSVLVFSIFVSLFALSISGPLPGWLGGKGEIAEGARQYLRINVAFLPALAVTLFCGATLSCSGNMKIPSLIDVFMCAMDVIFNFLLIFPTREISLLGLDFTIPGAGLGIKGAALGTGIAECLGCVAGLYFLLVKSPELAIAHEKGSFRPTRVCLENALGITGPLWLQNIIVRGAYVASTVIVAPLGAVAIAANSFAVTAESFCYMPGYGMSDAATTLVGQSLGAKRRDLAGAFSTKAVWLGAAIMSFMAVLMFIFATLLMSMLSVDPEVVSLGAKCLRLEAFAETLYAVSIVSNGAMTGAGDTLIPSFLNFGSMWLIRIPLALIFTPKFGLIGFWMAMCLELNIRGLLFLARMKSGRWMEKKLKYQ